MMLPDWPVLNAALDWLANGLWHLSWWQVVLYTLATTHITIASVTIFLHRSQAHRALDLHPIPSHVFRAWLWLSTGMVTKEWVAIHRKHHAKCETEDDPHSPQTRGLETVLWRGAELYRAEAKNTETLAKYGHGTPNDWIERNLYSRYTWQGVGLMLIINVALFGALGLTVWAVQMIWIPLTAAGIVNGIGHYWGYRNFETTDASANISPWGLIIGGEELHNNHHTYPTSAKFSIKKYEFDLGWVYVSLMRRIGWATVKKVPPKMQLGAIRPVADEQTLEALIANRYEVMAAYGRELKRVCKAEIATRRARQADFAALKAAKRWLHRDEDRVPASARPQLVMARAAPGARQDAGHARRAAPDVAQHLAVARAARRRPAILVLSRRRKWHRGLAAVFDAPAFGALLIQVGNAPWARRCAPGLASARIVPRYSRLRGCRRPAPCRKRTCPRSWAASRPKAATRPSSRWTACAWIPVGARSRPTKGVRVADNQNSLKYGTRGPVLLEDFILREKGHVTLAG